MIAFVLAAIVFIPMLFEAVVAARHDRELRRSGAVEPTRDVYPLMQLAYPAGFLAMIFEAWYRDPSAAGAISTGGMVVFAAAKGLKYWAIMTLGRRWTFRVLVPPGSSRTVAGPYRFLRHPNYAAVIGELVGATLIAHAWLGGPISIILFAALLRKRIEVEERALGLRAVQSRS